MNQDNDQFSLFGNTISKSKTRKIKKLKKKLAKEFHYTPDEKYQLSHHPNEHLGNILGIRNILKNNEGVPIKNDNSIVINTIRMGYGHYRIAMAGASCGRAMGYTPLWLDFLSIPGITSDLISTFETKFNTFSRFSQKSNWFNKYLWEPLTSGSDTLYAISKILNNNITTWPWRYIKASLKERNISELFKNLHEALPKDIPILNTHFFNSMGAAAAGMTNNVNMVFDNWPMAFQLIEGAKHGIQSPSAYYGFRVMNGFDEKNRIMNPVPSDAVHFVGHHIDHELVENIETDCENRLTRMHNKEPRRLLLTMGGAGAQRDLFKAIINHCLPLIKQEKITLIVNLGDHSDNLKWLMKELHGQNELINVHNTWEKTEEFTESIKNKSLKGLHLFCYDNAFHGVYATNFLMRHSDILITKPGELAFYPIPKIFNARVGGHEKWGAIRGAEIGDSTIETRSIGHTLQAIEIMSLENDLLEMYCSNIMKNKSIGLYDGAYKCIELATGKKWLR